MINNNRIRLSKLAFAVALAMGTVPAFAQNTTSAIGGRVTGTDGRAIAGAQVTIVHKESGSTSSTATDAEGRYNARGLRTGGPYLVTITKDGVTDRRDNVYLQLAETANVDAKLGGTQAVETIVVTGQNVGSDKFSPTAMGAGTSISRAELDAFASIQRNLQDYARIDPRVSQTDKERGEMSVAGQNSRFNSITIDGVAINDTFGIESNGLPTLKQPISIDAIQSVQVNVSNYDVTQKGYTGANVNAVTKSGTNDFHGSLSYVYRDDKWVGQRYNRTNDTYSDAPVFEETTKGFTLGGPIIKDKLFFFAGYEELKSTRNAPALGPIGSPLTNIGITPSAIASAQSIATSRYSIDVGSSTVPNGTELSAKDTLLKLDWNISAKHRANIRYTKTEQVEPIFPNFFATPSTALSLSSDWYSQIKKIETTVAQVFSDWTPTLSTEAKVSVRDYHSEPKNNSTLPLIQLSFTGALPVGTPAGVQGGTRNLFMGTERSRHFNILDTKTDDGYLGANWLLGAHEVKIAGDYSQNKVFNAFLQDTNGNYVFNCQNSSATYTYTFGAITCATATAAQVEAAVLENFSRGRPTTYTVQVPQAGGSLADGIARFTLKNYGAALQDTWTINPNLTVTFGVRVDTPKISEKPKFNASAAAPLVPGDPATNIRQSGGFGMDNSQSTIDGQDLIQPRFGFNYTFDSARPMQVRGGIGLFEGAAATVWLSNPFSNTGAATRVVGCGGNNAACSPAGGLFSADPKNQPTTFAGAVPAQNVDFLESGLGQPAVWKANLAFEHELPLWGVVAGIEYLYTQTQTGIYYQFLNLGAPTRTGTDGRNLYYTPTAYNPVCWTAAGSRLTTGAVCSVNNRTRALSNPNFANVLMASKTSEGQGNLATVSLSRPMAKDWGWSLSYTYTTATEVSGLTSSVSNSNWAARAILNPNENNAANSVYLVRDRINGTLNWQHSFFSKFKTTVGFFYEGRTGKPYSWTFLNDANGDNLAGNDLMYIPKGPGSGEVVFLGDTATDKSRESAFWEFVNATPDLSKARGSVVKRNASFSPWTNSIDMRISQQIPTFFKEHKAVFTLDLLNVGNMLNKKWGRIDEIGFQSNGGQPRGFVNFVGLDSAGRYIYSMTTASDFTTRQNRGESQWALQATVKYEF